MVNEDNEIVYDDPGSVTDIRKRFGIRTKNDFITPKGYRCVVFKNKTMFFFEKFK